MEGNRVGIKVTARERVRIADVSEPETLCLSWVCQEGDAGKVAATVGHC